MTDIDRREFVLAGAGASALGLAGPVVFAPSTANAADGFFTYRIGEVEVIGLHDGVWERPLDPGFVANAEMADVADALARGGHPRDVVPISFAQTLLRVGDRTILVDAGTGGQLAPTAGRMMEHLRAAGVDPAAIDTVLISHFHPDHIFGLMESGDNAQVFPDAEIVVPEREIAFWTDPATIAALPQGRKGLAERAAATLGTWDNVRRIGADVEVAPGVRSRAAYGHTPGHTAYVVSSGGETLVIAADIANVPALFVANPGWHAVFDMDAAAAEAARRALFEEVIADGHAIAGYHFGFPNAGRIERDGEGYAFVPMGG